MSNNNYLKPMLDTGSPRVFNCNEMTSRVLESNQEASLFFQNKALNNIVLIKDTVPEQDQSPGMPSVGTKLYFPFNDKDIYEGGRTIYLHDKNIEAAIIEYCGEGVVTKESMAHDIKFLSMLSRLPSLDPFLMKDVFIRDEQNIDEGYFEVTKETWERIETFMLQKFEPLIMAAFPDAKSSDEKARQLIDTIWEARDLDALMPLVEGFRLPKEKALDIFSSWKGIVYYSYQYTQQQAYFVNLIKWLGMEVTTAGVTAADIKAANEKQKMVKDQLRKEWQTTDTIVKDYQSSYDKMFVEKISSADFLSFLQNSDKIYWKIGNSLGKVNHATYCWDVMSSRYKDRKTPWPARQEIMNLLAKVLEPEKKQATSVSWS